MLASIKTKEREGRECQKELARSKRKGECKPACLTEQIPEAAFFFFFLQFKNDIVKD